MKIEDMNNDSMKGKKVEVLDDEGKVIEDGICIGVEDDEVLIYDRGEGFSCEKKNCRVVW
jgi:glycine cleavage system aminomethyltransferase T